MTKSCGVYVHIPFCKSRCAYCSFCSSVYNREVEQQYFQKLFAEIDNVIPKHTISSIFFGGGTPSVVKPENICLSLNKIFKKFDVETSAEITLEANPGTVTEECLKKYCLAGFNRISFGGQSFDEIALKKLGRTHSVKQIFEAVEMAKTAGFDNINLDLILGAEPLNHKSFVENIKKCKSLGVTHLSVYILMLENGTRLFEEVENKTKTVLSDEDVTKDYLFVQTALKNLGFIQYEISNFALIGKECQHNLNYWKCGNYYGFGASAHRFLNGIREENVADVHQYTNLPIDNITLNQEILTKQDKITEFIMLGLRTTKGVCLKTLVDLGYDIQKEKQGQLKVLLGKKMVQIKDGFLRICPKNFVLSNQIILKLIP